MSQDPLRLLIRAVSQPSGPVELLAADRATQVYELKSCSFLSFPPAASGNPGNTERIVLPKDVPTRYKRDESSFYDLASLLFCFLRQDDGAGEYFKAAGEQQVVPAGVMERRAVVELLQGKRPEGEQVVPLDASATLTTTAATASASPTKGQNVRSTTPDEPPPDELPPSLPATGERPAKKAKYVPVKEDQELVKKLLTYHESKQLADRETALRGAKPVSFDHLKSLIGDKLNSARLEFQRGSAPDRAAPGAPARGSERKKKPMQPIIIVSPSASALITMHNIKGFLEDAHFVPSQQAVASGGKVLEDTVAVNHRRQLGSTAAANAAPGKSASSSSSLGASGAADRTARYWVVDSVAALSKFGSSDVWDRVVCVMTTGQEWQFKPYKWSEPRELFHNVKGIHFHWSNEPINESIKKWNVSTLRMDPTRRHSDKSVVAEFWRLLELWIASHKPYLQW